MILLSKRSLFNKHDCIRRINLILLTWRSFPPFSLKMVSTAFQAQFIAQSIGQAFQVAYMEFLKANGIEDHSFVKEMDYQEVLNSQEIFGDELQMFAKKVSYVFKVVYTL